MKKKPKDITYIGIHNRRTDHLTFLRETMKMKDLEELGKDFFMDGMEYFRYYRVLILVAHSFLDIERGVLFYNND